MAGEVRSVYTYELHGHAGTPEEPIDYTGFFDDLMGIHQNQRQSAVRADGDPRVVAIPEIRNPKPGRYAVRFVIGREGDPALFYDLRTGEERLAAAGEGEISAVTAWWIVDTDLRLVLQERRRPGVPLKLAVEALIDLSREHQLGEGVSFSLNPAVRDSFFEEVEQLERIKSATVVLHKPNTDWGDAADSILAKMGGESNMASVEITGKARRNQSLSKSSGLVAEVVDMVRQSLSPLRYAKLVGRKMGESRDTTVSTKDHAERNEVEIPDGATLDQATEALLAEADHLLDSETSPPSS